VIAPNMCVGIATSNSTHPSTAAAIT
jgi:hypothetical protein